MTKYTLTPIKVLGFLLFISILFSCSKDSDLLAEYVIQDTAINPEPGQGNNSNDSNDSVDSTSANTYEPEYNPDYETVENYSALLELTPEEGLGMNVLGYSSANDGGGGIFQYDSTKSGINNSGTILNGWVRLYNGAINIKWFGAKGDGLTDDTVSINNALSLGGTIVGVEGETYLVTALISGVDNTIIKFTGCTIKRKAATLSHILTITGDNIIMDGGTFDGNKTGGQSGEEYDHSSVFVLGGDYCTIKNTISVDIYGIGLKTNNANYCDIFNNEIYDSTIQGIYSEPYGNINYGLKIRNNKVIVSATDGSCGIYVASTGNINSWNKQYLIENNFVEGNMHAGLESNNILITARGNNGIIKGNVTVGGRMGISNDYNKNGLVEGNNVKDFTQFGIEIVGWEDVVGGCDNIVVKNNTIQSNMSTANGIDASGKTINNIIIKGNYIMGCYHGIKIICSIDTWAENAIISNNHIINPFYRHLQLRNNKGLTIAGNVFESNKGITCIQFDETTGILMTNNSLIGTFTAGVSFYSINKLMVDDTLITENDFNGYNTIYNDGNGIFGPNFVFIN